MKLIMFKVLMKFFLIILLEIAEEGMSYHLT